MTRPGPDAAVPGHAVTDATATLPVAGGPEAPASVPAEAADDAAAAERSKRQKGREKKSPWRIAAEWVILIAIALGIAFLIKSFLFQAFYIPSESMVPTLNVGDRVLVNKLSTDPDRGDIVVFEAPAGATGGGIEDLVKRVIGLPGDTVTFPGDGRVVVNGRVLEEPYLPADVDTCFPSLPCPSEPSADKVVPGCGTPKDGQPGCVVPDGRYLMLGDNRESSKDSRVFGPIDQDTIVGRVFVRIWPLSDVDFL